MHGVMLVFVSSNNAIVFVQENISDLICYSGNFKIDLKVKIQIFISKE